MTDSSRHKRLLIALALLVLVVALWWFGRVNGAAVPIVPEAKPPPARATPAAVGGASAAPSAERAKVAASPETWHEPERRSGVDASNIYKNAFVLFNDLTDAEKKMFRNPTDEVDAAAAAALFEKIQPILAMLREAVKAEYCDWGLEPLSIDTPMNHLKLAQELSRLTRWSAAYRLGSDPGGAIEDLRAQAHLGHHVSDMLIGGIVAMSFEAMAAGLLRDNLGALDPDSRAAAADFLNASTLDADFGRAFATEGAAAERMLKDLSRKPPPEREKLLAEMPTDPSRDPGEGRESEMRAILDSPERLRAEAEFIRTTEEKIGNSLALSETDFQAWWDATKTEMKRQHPFAEMLVPSVEMLRERVQQRRVERTLFTAGVDVLQNGPAQLGRYRDPATGRALTYVPTPAGFELRLQFGVKGKPVTMSFPHQP